MQFQVEATSGPARAGRLITPHGEVETPVFMPVGTAATVKGVPQDILEELGVQILLGNTYHLYLRPGVETVRRMGGLHRFMAWNRAILTDSGGFQVFSLNDLRKVSEEGVTFRSHLDGSSHFFSPESAIAAQIALGADIIMAFDECTEYPAERERVRESMELTLRWAERSKRHFEEHKRNVPWRDIRKVGEYPVPSTQYPASRQPSAISRREPVGGGQRSVGSDSSHQPSVVSHQEEQVLRFAKDDSSQKASHWPLATDNCQLIFGIVQGGMDPELRRESAERTVEIGFDGYAIGGLSVGEPRAVTREIAQFTLQHLPKDKPRYLMGVGTPEEIAEYARMGIDMMDCVLPTRAARHGLLFTSEGKVSIKQARYAEDESPLDPACRCRVCRRYSRAYLRHLYASNELLAQVLNTIHNVSFYLDTMRAVRHSIQLGAKAPFLSEASRPNP